MKTARRCCLAAFVVLTVASHLAAAPVATSEWLGRVRQEIRDSEYEISWQVRTDREDVPAAWQAPNRANGLRTYFTEEGIRVVPRTERTPSWEWGLALAATGRAGAWQPAESASLSVSRNRVDLDRGDIAEWYVNSPRGLEQGFTLRAPPGGGRRTSDGAAYLALRLTGTLSPAISEDGQAVDFVAPGGARVLRYAELGVTDAAGREIPARIEGYAVEGARGIRLVVDDRDAVYPLTIDPLATSAAWTGEADQAVARFGLSVATAGDVNGDGHSDVIVGAPFYDNGEADEGRAFVYEGSAAGLSLVPSWAAEGAQAGARFGDSVATAGDVNGDGYSDVIVGAPYHDNGEVDEGAAFVFHGSAAGLGSAPAWSAEGSQAGAAFGVSVATAGDVNGDGHSDVIVGAPAYDRGQPEEGRAFLYHGSAIGLGVAPAWSAEGDQPGASFGMTVATAGDVNADGFQDVIVGAPGYDNVEIDEGGAFVYVGSPAGLASTPAWRAEGNQVGAAFGTSVAGLGDVNGDGYSDVIVGASGYDHGELDEGRALAYDGSAVGLALVPSWAAEGNQAGAGLGISVSTAGDVNGDGYADAIVGASGYDHGELDEGQASVYAGSAAGLGAAATWTAEGDQAGAALGVAVATAGDVNGDGYSDVVAGAPGYDGGETDEGRAFLYQGAGDGLAGNAAWTAEGNQAGAGLGVWVASAGDVNGDGYSDVIVGAYAHDNGQADEGRAYVYCGSSAGPSQTPAWVTEGNQAGAAYGWSVGTAGDVNGDGYSDVIVGAVYWDKDSFVRDEGRVFVYHGSASGLGTLPAWTAEGNQGYAYFGESVGTAGDVNGDGYSDAIIGADSWNGSWIDEGRAYVYHGSAAGLGASPAWTALGGQAGANLGISVGTAGDVNGDGYSDVIVGAYAFGNGETNEGRALVYHGARAGLGAGPAWSAESNQAYAFFGFSVGTAGDVDGDGHSDVIVGAYAYSNGETEEGRAFVYHGSPAGLGQTAAWTAESDQAGADLGITVGTAGDVNGDGYSDVIVAAHHFDNGQVDEGRAFVYSGSPAGLGPIPAWTAESDQDFAYLGVSVATAGDVNGDGYSDVIVGAYAYDGDQANEGGARVYQGAAGGGLDVIPRQFRADDAAAVSLLGASDSETSFRLKALARTPAGRGKVRLEWEVRALGEVFDGGDFASGPWSDVGAPVDQLVSGLAAARPYHWRLRIAADSPFFPRTRWVSMPGNAVTEDKIKTPGPDADGDWVADPIDNCPGISNTNQADADGDLHGDACDCAPSDPGVFASPQEIRGLAFRGDKSTLEWASDAENSGMGTAYDVMRGILGQWPVGAGGSETCIDPGSADTAAEDPAQPAIGNGFYYLARARSVCGAGTYGFRADGAERTSEACP